MNKKIYAGMVFIVIVLFLVFYMNSTTAYQRSDFLRLIENTDQCLVDCYAIIEVSNPTGGDITFDINNWRIWHEKAPGAKGLVEDLKFQLLEDVSYEFEVNDFEELTESLVCDGDFGFEGNDAWCFSGNGNLTWNHSFEAIVPEDKKIYRTVKKKVGSHKEKKLKKKYVDFNPAGKILKPGETYQIKIIGKKKAQIGPNNVDWKIKFLDYEPDWAWWNSSWGYKRPIEINSTNDLTDYQLAINVTYDSDMQSDFNDLRFVNEEETLSLDYWVESKSDGNYAYVWVEVDSIDTDNGTQAYMYYGNAEAINKSNAKATFLLFDDFDTFEGWDEGPENSGYTIGSPSVDVSNSHLYPDNYGSRANYGWHGPVANISFTPVTDFVLKIKHYWLCEYYYQWQVIHLRSASSYVLSTDIYDGANGPYGSITLRNSSINDMGGGSTIISNAGTGYCDFRNKYEEITRVGNTVTWTVDGIQKYSGNQSTAPIDNIRIIFGQAGTYPTNINEISQIILRKYTSPEPTYSIGGEETKPAPPVNVSGGTIKTTSGNITLDPATGIVEIDGSMLSMRSPDESWFCCGPNNTGSWICSAGKCT